MHPFKKDAEEEQRVSDDVSLEEADRLLIEAVAPFEAVVAHPKGGAGDSARDEVEKSADGYGVPAAPYDVHAGRLGEDDPEVA